MTRMHARAADAAPTLAAAASPMLAADGDVVGLHLLSPHSDSGFETVTPPGICYRMANGMQAGVYRNSYRNSYRDTSVYGGCVWSLDQAGHFGVLLGAASGYKEASGLSVVPIVTPQVGVELMPGLWARAAWFIAAGAQDAQALHISLEHQLGAATPGSGSAPAARPAATFCSTAAPRWR